MPKNCIINTSKPTYTPPNSLTTNGFDQKTGLLTCNDTDPSSNKNVSISVQ